MSSGVSYVPLVSPVSVSLGGLAVYAVNNTDGTDPLYIGKVRADGVWLMQKYTATGVMTYANLSNNGAYATYADAWAARAALIYGGFETITGA